MRKITRDMLSGRVQHINQLTLKFHMLHEYRGRYKLIKEGKNETGFMEPKHLYDWLCAYIKGIQDGITINLNR